MILRTTRLLLRPPVPADGPALFGFMGDPVAMRHTHHFSTLRDLRRHIAGHEWQRRRTGCAPWTVIEAATGAIIGWGGLYEDPFDRGWGIELAYVFAPGAWGRGFASELAKAALADARDRLGLPEVRAFTRPDNAASRRVLEKSGFVRVGFVPELERDRFVCGLAPPFAAMLRSAPLEPGDLPARDQSRMRPFEF